MDSICNCNPENLRRQELDREAGKIDRYPVNILVLIVLQVSEKLSPVQIIYLYPHDTKVFKNIFHVMLCKNMID